MTTRDSLVAATLGMLISRQKRCSSGKKRVLIRQQIMFIKQQRMFIRRQKMFISRQKRPKNFCDDYAMQVCSSTEQDTPEIESMKQATAAADQEGTSGASHPMISSLPEPVQNSSKIYPKLMQDSPRGIESASPRESSGFSKINPTMTHGQSRYLNNQHHVHFAYAAHHAQRRARAKKKVHKWCFLATLVTAIAVALFFFLFCWK